MGKRYLCEITRPKNMKKYITASITPSKGKFLRFAVYPKPDSVTFREKNWIKRMINKLLDKLEEEGILR